MGKIHLEPIPKNQQYEHYISARQAIRQGLIPWIKSIPTLTKWIKNQMEHPEASPIKVIVQGKGNGVRYYILKKSLKGISNLTTGGPLKGIVRF
ncbi:MAG: hypothetical protein Q8R55_03740 [Candidatus Taylorbacteria bacterium]|nr:hypothetical protein [Candidatus Taylorbacteria bacterium]